MATPSSSNTLTFDEWVKRMDKNETRAIVEIVAQENQALQSMMVSMGNESEGNTTTLRSTQAQGEWTGMNQGVSPEATKTREIWDAAGTIEAYSVIPMRYLDRSPSAVEAREQEIVAFVQGLGESVESIVWNGDRHTDPMQFTGFDQRYASLSGETAGQIIDAGGVGSNDNTSIYFVAWGPMAASLFFGQNQQAGLKIQDRGQQTLDRYNDGKLQECAVTYFCWQLGLMVKDYKAVSRIANITSTSLPSDIADLLIDGYFALPNRMRSNRVVIYCNRTIVVALTKQARAQSNNNLTMENWEGTEIVHFMGMPIIQTDTITNSNARIV